MVDNIEEEYVLQWEGHAGHVTERFSGLFARQSLVDVTLICEEQRLRVHKLVLASCSLYFEEMLEQDLGQEPTILLSDLNFQVLKSMVEFMYCGETSISKENSEPLLHAARIFKVKELASIAENLMGFGTTDAVEEDELKENTEYPDASKEETDSLEYENDYSLFSDNDSSRSFIWNEIEIDDELSTNELDKENFHSDNNETDIEEEEEESLAEDSITYNSKVPLSLAELALKNLLKYYKEEENLPQEVKVCIEKVYEHKKKDDLCDRPYNRNRAGNKVWEQSYDIVNSDSNLYECGIKSSPQKHSKHDSSFEFNEFRRTVTVDNNKRLKVYTHNKKCNNKILRIFNNDDNSTPDLVIGNENCIDLIEEPSRRDTELKKDDYFLNLDSENLVLGEDFVDNKEKEEENEDEVFQNEEILISHSSNRITSNEKERLLSSDRTKIYNKSNVVTTALRRSVRLSHQENELDSTNNNNNNNNNDNSSNQDLRKENSMKRNKNKESSSSSSSNLLYFQSNDNNCIKKCLNSSSRRSLRSNGNRKLIERRCNSNSNSNKKSRLSLSKNGNMGELEEEKSSSSSSSLLRNNDDKRFMNIDSNLELCKTKFNTIATVSRCLWGDMSDCIENNNENENNDIDLSDNNYSKSKEIPFAVGLLPLRDALERMQATPDYQPRKTRSSVGVTSFIRREFKTVKRKTSSSSSNDIESINSVNKIMKRQQNSLSDEKTNGSNLISTNNNSDTVCHVRITTTRTNGNGSHSESSGAVRNRRKFINQEEIKVDSNNDKIISQNCIVNRQ